MTLRVAKILHDSVTDGPGLRVVVFLQGCPHCCEGCHNPDLLDLSGGTKMTAEDVLADITRNPLTSGVTFSGGEPMAQAEALLPLARALRERGYNLWIYTGFIWEELNPVQMELAALTDVIVDGPFVQLERSLSLLWRGSKNQRVLDAQKSLAEGKAVELA